MKYISKLIPQKFKQDSKIYRSISSIVIVDLMILGISLIFIPIFAAIGFFVGAKIMFYAVIAALFYLILLRLTENLDILGGYFTVQSLIVTLAMMKYTGGIGSPYLFWLMCISPLTFLFFKERQAIFWSSITIFCFLAFALTQIFGIPFEQELPLKVFYILFTINFCFACGIFIITFRSFENTKKKTSRKLQHTNKQLHQSNQELERFAYIASHDLKSPVRGIINFIKLFNRRYGKNQEEGGKEYLQIISNNANQMYQLIEDILEYSKSNNREIKKEHIDMNDVLLDIKTKIENSKTYPNAKILFDNLPCISSDSTMISQIFHNFIENGLKYNNSSTKIIFIRMTEKKDKINFIINDNGIGMEEEYLDQIFEMFKRLHNQNEYKGTGIGLAICKKLIDQLDGKIRVTSKVGEGSTFHLSFPKSILSIDKKEIPSQEEKELESFSA